MALQVAKKVANGVLYTNGMIRVDNVVASYPHVDAPYAGEDGGVPKYSVQGIGNKETHAEVISLVRDEMKRILAEKKMTIPGGKLFMKDGDKYFEGKDECMDAYIFTAREETRPTLRDAAGRKLDPKDDMDKIKELFYGGAVVSILINPWVQDNKFGKRINANLKAVRFVKDGTPFGEARVDDEDAWDDIEEEGFDDTESDDDI